MTTIVRVKRHRTEDPVEALVLSCKRKKTGDSNSENDLFEKVLNFSGTVEDKDDKVAASTVQSFNKESKYSDFQKNHNPEIRSKQRKERRERSEGKRFTLLSCLRASSDVEKSEVDAKSENFTIVDVSKECKQKVKEHDASEGCYVYDLYSVQETDSDFNDIFMENLLSVQPLHSELEYRNGEDVFEEIDPDEDDSNDENNWRNDYPDTGSSMDDDEDNDLLARQLKRCNIGSDDCELSDDSAEDEYLHYDDSERYHYYEAEDLAGRRYAKYKANAMKHLIDEVDLESSESEDDFHDCEVLSYHGDSE